MTEKHFIDQITLEEMRDEVKRELDTRRRVYPRWIADGKIKKEVADLRILIFQALLVHLNDKLKAQKQLNNDRPSLF